MEVTYEYYQDNYGGSRIPESRWKTLETKMRARLNRYTFDRMSENNWPEQAKTALCEMCECAYQYRPDVRRPAAACCHCPQSGQ